MGTEFLSEPKFCKRIIKNFKIPCQTMELIDVIPNNNKYYFGRATHGPRYPNFIIQNADYIYQLETAVYNTQGIMLNLLQEMPLFIWLI